MDHGYWKYFCFCVGLALLCSMPVQAAFVGSYSVANFTLTNKDSSGGLSGTNGFVFSPDGGLSVILTGGNSGSGLSGMTDWVIHAAMGGLVQFQYSYASLDAPGADLAGYLLATNFFQLSDTNGLCNGVACPGTVQFSVSAGESFGFRVITLDNQGEPGVLTISAFSAPSSDPIGSPEPNTCALILGALVALAVRQSCGSNRKYGRTG